MHEALRFPSIILIALALVACRGAGRADQPPAQTDTLASGQPLPTIAPTAVQVALAPTGEPAPPEEELLQTIRGDVQPFAQSIFGLTGEGGDTVRIEVVVRSGVPDLVLELSTPDGQALTHVDGGGPGESEVIGEFRFPTTGYYELSVGSHEGAGQIDVLVYRLSAPSQPGGDVIPGFDQPVGGSMNSPATIHSYSFQVQRGQRFDLRAVALSGDLDLLFELYDPQGELVASRDDSLGYDPYLFNHMPAEGGEYTLVLTNYQQTTGTYQVVLEHSQSSGQMSLGRNQTIALPTEPDHGVWLTFVGAAGEGISLEAEPISPDVDLTLAVYDVYGNQLGFTDVGAPGQSERLRVQFPYDGPYQVEFGTLREGGQIRYDVVGRTPFDFDENGPLLGFPTTRNIAIETREIAMTYAYWFDGEEGQRVTFDGKTEAGTLDLAFDLYDQAGNLLSAHDDDRGRDPVLENFELPFTGRYYFVLRVGGDHRGGEFRLRAEMPPPPDREGDG